MGKVLQCALIAFWAKFGQICAIKVELPHNNVFFSEMSLVVATKPIALKTFDPQCGKSKWQQAGKMHF